MLKCEISLQAVVDEWATSLFKVNDSPQVMFCGHFIQTSRVYFAYNKNGKFLMLLFSAIEERVSHYFPLCNPTFLFRKNEI